MINTLIPLTGDSNVVREKHKKFRFMKKEYLSPEMQVVKISMDINILAQSVGETDKPVIPDAKEYNDVSNDNTTTGGSIWDKEW